MMKRVNFTISEVEIKRLKTLTKKTGLSASEILRRAIDEYWDRNKPGKKVGD
jgi:predicted DNA-binding protein